MAPRWTKINQINLKTASPPQKENLGLIFGCDAGNLRGGGSHLWVADFLGFFLTARTPNNHHFCRQNFWGLARCELTFHMIFGVSKMPKYQQCQSQTGDSSYLLGFSGGHHPRHFAPIGDLKFLGSYFGFFCLVRAADLCRKNWYDRLRNTFLFPFPGRRKLLQMKKRCNNARQGCMGSPGICQFRERRGNPSLSKLTNLEILKWKNSDYERFELSPGKVQHCFNKLFTSIFIRQLPAAAEKNPESSRYHNITAFNSEIHSSKNLWVVYWFQFNSFFLCKTKNRVSIQKKEFLYIFFIFGLLHKKEPLVNMSDAFLAVCFCIFLQENSAEQKMQSADVAHRKMMTTN